MSEKKTLRKIPQGVLTVKSEAVPFTEGWDDPVPISGSVYEQDGRIYKILWMKIEWSQLTNDLNGVKVLRSLRSGQSIMLPNGARFMKKGRNLFRILKRDVTMQQLPPRGKGYRKMPSGEKFSKLTEKKAREAVLMAATDAYSYGENRDPVEPSAVVRIANMLTEHNKPKNRHQKGQR